MATGQEIETRGHIVGFREEIANAATTSADAFFTWFDAAPDKDVAFVRGSWDFSTHIAAPAARYLATPEQMTALEIGHGGGRLLAAAARAFGQVIGVDVHDNNAQVEAELMARGVRNCRLIQADGQKIPVEDGAIDFVYSYIVLQHVERYAVFAAYLAETARVLKPGGVAVIYFGRKTWLSLNRSSRVLLQIDATMERWLVPGGYAEVPARVNEVNLVVGLRHARKMVQGLGFVVRETLLSRKRGPGGVMRFGGQHGLVLIKP